MVAFQNNKFSLELIPKGKVLSKIKSNIQEMALRPVTNMEEIDGQ